MTEVNTKAVHEGVFMKKIVSFSGGRTSAYLCKLMIEKFGKENVDFVFMDTGAEHLKTYEFVRSVNDELGLGLICLRGDFSAPLGGGVGYNVVDISNIGPDLTPFKGMIKKYGVPYIGGMFCTDRMKLKPFKKYCDDTYGKGNYETWIGIRFDEPKRLIGDNPKKSLSAYKLLKGDGFNDEEISCIYNEAMENIDVINQWKIKETAKIAIRARISNLKKDNINNMSQICDHEKQDVLNWWGKKSFDLKIEEWSGNCEFCPKKSDLKLAASQRDSPKSYINYVEMLHDDSVRVDKNTGDRNHMYRGKQSIESLIAKFDGSTGAEIKSRIKGAKMLDVNSCSESCELIPIS